MKHYNNLKQKILQPPPTLKITGKRLFLVVGSPGIF
jgi:hypothetical protein